jgi:hypothetical protein
MATAHEIRKLIAQTTTGTHRRHVPRGARKQIRRCAASPSEGRTTTGADPSGAPGARCVAVRYAVGLASRGRRGTLSARTWLSYDPLLGGSMRLRLRGAFQRLINGAPKLLAV